MPRYAIACIAALAAAASACTYDDRHHHDGEGPDYVEPPVEEPMASSAIDTGATLADIEPGRGAGAFVEYESGGKWHVYTACDTELSGTGCMWDIIVSVADGDEITTFDRDQLEGSDTLDWYSPQSVQLLTNTTYDFDGFRLEATAGAPLVVDVYLDGDPAPKYIYWVGDGALHRGAPTNPIELVPTAP